MEREMKMTVLTELVAGNTSVTLTEAEARYIVPVLEFEIRRSHEHMQRFDAPNREMLQNHVDTLRHILHKIIDTTKHDS